VQILVDHWSVSYDSRVFGLGTGSNHRMTAEKLIKVVKCYLAPSGSQRCTQHFHVLGYNEVRSPENQTTFRRNMLPLSSGSNNKQNMKWGGVLSS
jgi:hypothetical protein